MVDPGIGALARYSFRMKKVYYIHQYFKMPEEGGAIRSYYVAKGMVSSGMHVEMITSHNEPAYEKKTIEGIIVHYLPVRYLNQFSTTQRYFSFFKFVWQTILLLRKLPNPDLIYATSTPLSVGFIALWEKWVRKTPYFFEVRDLWPEAPIQLGVLRSGFLIRMFKALEKKIYKRASHIIALSPGIDEGIKKSYPDAKSSMIPNMADIDFYKPDVQGRDHGKFIIGYFGAISRANNIDFILAIAEISERNRLPVHYLIAGDGQLKEEIIERSSRLQNIELLPLLNRADLKQAMSRVDACLTTFLDIPVLSTNSPNKFFDGLAAGKLSIVNTPGWLSKLVIDNECGIYVPADDPAQIITKIELFVKNLSLLESYQKNARKLAIQQFDKNKLTEHICKIIHDFLAV